MKELLDIVKSIKWQVMSNELRERITVSGDPVNNDSLRRSRLRSRWLKACALSALVIGVFSSCSDDLEVNKGINPIQDGKILLRIYVPDAPVVKTRADESQSDAEKTIKDNGYHYALIYGSDSKLKHIESLDISDTKTTIDFEISNSVSLDGAKIIVVANAPSAITINNANDYSDLQGLYDELNSSNQPASPFVMSGIAEATTNGGNNYSVSLQRTAAKISMELDSSVKNFTMENYTMYNATTKGYYIAAVSLKENTLDKIYNAGTQNIVVTSGARGFYNYTYPVLSNAKDINTLNKAYFIVKGQYEGETCYYRVDLRKQDSSGYFDINPNHWYQIEIVEVRRKGYPTADEAAKRYMGMEEDPSLNVKIHDHVAAVMTMTTDGLRELGADREVKMTSSEAFLTIKCYSAATSYATEILEEPKVEIIDGSWLKIGDITSYTDAPTSGDQDEDNPGAQWKVHLETTGIMYSDDEATLKVTWQGLEREVKVYYTTEFKISEICDVVLTMTPGSGKGESVDYWPFLSETLKGIKKSQLADEKVRDEGFHFPMPYGTTQANGEGDLSPWTYSYKLTFKADINASKISSVTASVPSSTDSYLRSVKWTYNNDGTGDLVLSGENKFSYSYATGSISFVIKYNDTTPDLPFSVDLYHTGFFHKDANYSDAYYYYEVVDLGGKHWLDRNIGATSNMMYSNNDGINDSGNSEARGSMIKIANAVSYKDPEQYYKLVCPPGYRVPNTTDWDALRLSANFTTGDIQENNDVFSATYYDTNNDNMGNVYFPKSRFYNSTQDLDDYNNGGSSIKTEDTNSGNSGSGYYWTTTASSGLEKEEMGAWLQVLNLSGSSNTYISGSIRRHQMNVRCIATPDHTSEQRFAIDFNVKGATHVFLYTENADGSKNGIFSFPGKAIGSTSAVNSLNYSKTALDNGYDSDDSYLHFSYTSTISESNMKVFFAYVDDATSEIKILSRNNEQTLADATGWPVQIGYNYFFYWNTDNELDEVRIFKAGTSQSTGKQKYRLYWPRTKGSGIHVWQWDASQDLDVSYTGAWGEGEGTVDSRATYYYLDFESDLDTNICFKFTSNGSNEEFNYPISDFLDTNFGNESRRCAFISRMDWKYENTTINKGTPQEEYNPGKFEPYDIIRIRWYRYFGGYQGAEFNTMEVQNASMIKNSVSAGDLKTASNGNVYYYDFIFKEDASNLKAVFTRSDYNLYPNGDTRKERTINYNDVKESKVSYFYLSRETNY